MRFTVSVIGLVLVLVATAVLAGGDDKVLKTAPANPEKTATDAAAECEQTALVFVRENHPELANLLKQLKPMKPNEYDRAIREIANVSKKLASLKEGDPKRYELGLGLWKAKSRVELLTAKLISAPNPELENSLREAVAHQFDVEIEQQKYERDQAKARVKKLNESIERLETNQQKLIESRYQGFLKKSQRARNQDAGKPVPAQPVQAKRGESKA